MIDLGLQDNTIEIMNDLEFYTNLKSTLRLREQQAQEDRIVLFFDTTEQVFNVRICIDDLNIVSHLPKVFERTAKVMFRAWTEIHLPAWYYIEELVIEKNQDEEESLWQAKCKVTVSLKERKDDA